MASTGRRPEPPPAKAAPRRRKEARPPEIIEAALREFALNGYAGTRLDDVARRAGVAKGLIYRYFEDKEALFLAAMRSFARPVFEDLTRLVDAHAGGTEEILRLVFTAAHRLLATSDIVVILRIIIAEGRAFPALPELYYAESVGKARALLDRIVERGLARGDIRPGAAAELPMALAAPMVMAAVWRMTFQPVAPVEPEAFLRAHLDLVLHGILEREP